MRIYFTKYIEGREIVKTLPNLKAEMAREDISNIDLGQLLKKSKKAALF